jgi:tRNA-binding protein
MDMNMQEITWAEFEKVELRVGTILEVFEFPEARKPAYKLKVDFWGIRDTHEQRADHQAL